MEFAKTAAAVAVIAVAGWSCAQAVNVVDVTTPQGRTVKVDLITPDIVRVVNLAPGEADRAQVIPAVTPMDAIGSMAVDRTGTVTSFTTSTGLSVRVDASTGGVDISSGSSRAISDSGVRTSAGGRRTMTISTMGGGSFYGAGERGYSFNLAGDTLVMYNKQNYGYTAGEPRIRQMNITMPLFLSSNGYAVVFDDYAAAEMVMSNPIVYTTESPTPVAYYFVNSTGSLASLTGELTRLTGRQEMPPLWSLGYITSKYGYRTQAETVGVVDTLRRRGYPLDGIVLDLYWYGKEQDMGRLAWDPEQWPDHRKMLADLKADGVNTVIISQPYVLRNGKAVENYNLLTDKKYLLRDTLGGQQDVKIWVGEGGMFDVSNPDTRRWLSDRYRDLTLEGVGGWWGDLGEPEVHPESGLHANGLTAREYHNRYGNDWSRIIYDLYKEQFPDTRLMTMMRGGTTGLQRYSVFPWSTDVSRSWGGLQPQVTIMLNSGLSGLGYMSHDVGGFAIDEAMPYDPELYVRWLQLGAFSPVLRTHSQQTAEPYNYPAQEEEIILPLIRERYRWLPYNYTLAWENASKGYPLVRPLNFNTPGSALYDDIPDEYLWGNDVLVAPVLTKGSVSRRVVFPEGVWTDLARPGRLYNGGDTVTADAPLGVLPLYVRAGAFIPRADYAMRSTLDYRTDRYTVDFYPVSGASEYVMYEDDPASTVSLERGEFALVTFKGNADEDSVAVRVASRGAYPGQKPVKDMTFDVHMLGSRPASVTVDGKKVRGWKYDPQTATLTVNAKWNIDKPLEISIKK
ncbi:MAG: DUF5110 domain-containing protein [Duncaniella sp.]|nr:DUF5110 domain-containing protein [Duncaniella sp.]